MLAEIRGSCKQNREFANIAQKCFQNLANKKSVWSLCKVVQTKKTSHKVRGVLLREGLYKAFASCLSSAAVSGFLSSSSIFAASLSSLSVTAVSAVLGSVSSTGSGVLEEKKSFLQSLSVYAPILVDDVRIDIRNHFNLSMTRVTLD